MEQILQPTLQAALQAAALAAAKVVANLLAARLRPVAAVAARHLLEQVASVSAPNTVRSHNLTIIFSASRPDQSSSLHRSGGYDTLSLLSSNIRPRLA